MCSLPASADAPYRYHAVSPNATGMTPASGRPSRSARMIVANPADSSVRHASK